MTSPTAPDDPSNQSNEPTRGGSTPASPSPQPTGPNGLAPADTAPVDDLLAATGATPFVTAAHTLVPYVKSKGTYVPLLCDVGATSVTDAVESATTLITKLGLYPGKTKKLLKTYRKILTWCTEQDLDRLSELVDTTVERLITDLAGVPDLYPALRLSGTARLKTGALHQALAETARDLRRIHHVHNAVVSLRAATVLTRTRSRKQRVTADSLAYGLPALPPLADRKGRPLTDEEILLARFLVEIDHAEGAEPRPAIAYLLGESAVRPSESALLETGALDDRARPRTITVAGVWEFKERTVELTGYATATLPRLLRQLRPGDQPLSYIGSGPHERKAHSSVSDVIMRHLRRAGITDAEVTAKSLSLWRVQHTLVRTGDMATARGYHGGRTANVLGDLKVFANENHYFNGVVHLQRRDDEELLATVSTEGFYDDSFTDKGRWRRNRNTR